MPCVEFYQNNSTGDVVKCSFVHCKELGGGYTPTGQLATISFEEFRKLAGDIVLDEFDLFYKREYGIRSELYDEMTEAKRQRFFRDHAKVIVSWPIKTKPANIYIGRNPTLLKKLDYPFDKAVLTEEILAAFDKARLEDE
jgi:hypothetical protein